MKQTELKKLTKSLQRDCSKDMLQEVLDTYHIRGIRETINPNIIELESSDKDQFNIACINNDSLYLLHGEHNVFSHINKCQIKEEENITEVNYTEYEDQPLGLVVRESQYTEDPNLAQRLINCSMAIRKTKDTRYVLPQDIVDKKLPGLSIHMYDYNSWEDPILKEWYIENFVEYFTNNNLDVKLRNALKDQNNVLTKTKKD